MDKKQAMAILQLSGKPTLQDAKAAFRRLAKLHHPDHFAQDACAVIRAEKQMKAVNQAYHLLKFLLPQGAEKASPFRDMSEKMPSPGFADMVNRIQARIRLQGQDQSNSKKVEKISRIRPVGRVARD